MIYNQFLHSPCQDNTHHALLTTANGPKPKKNGTTDRSMDPRYCTLLANVTNDNCTIVPKLVKEIGAQMDELNSQGFSALHEAAFEGELARVETLVNCGASVNIKDLDSWTPLHAAVLGGNLHCVSFLARNGADLWAETADNQLPFHIAVERRDDNMIALLAQEMTNQTF